MRSTRSLLSLLPALTVSASVLPRSAGTTLSRSENVLLFDAPAYQQAACGSSPYEAEIQAYTYTSANGSVDKVVSSFSAFLEAYDIEVDDEALEILTARAKWFATTPIGQESVRVEVDGCARGFVVGKTAVPSNDTLDAGLAVDDGALGVCEGEKQEAVEGRAVLIARDNRKFKNSVFKSGRKGWGVISDIDETILISGDGLDAIRSTLIKETTPVSGMPDLYATLTKLIDPAWVYITGSPWQLYTMLHDFLGQHFAESTGPILMKNLTYTGVEGLVKFVGAGTSLDYKTGRIDQVHSWYPKKHYLAIGDSSATDPEAYAYAYHQYGPEWLKCIWIHLVDGGNNTQARFSEAFQGIPKSVVKLYTDPSELKPEALVDETCF